MPTNKCELCGEPMPPGEEVFKYHGYSGPCPKPLATTPSEARPMHTKPTVDQLANRFDHHAPS
ncbi:hypothetical protein, partial [Lactococcus petauri]|uniref:hypothetical protein n=1 Tax=Lactococcus petauri TaxID=1940789 RepID=UPI0021F0F82D